jgi:hypothetical protein
MWGLMSYLLVVCFCCKAQLVPLQIGHLLRWSVRMAIVTAADMAMLAGLGALLVLAGLWASRAANSWRIWRWSAGTICGAVGIVFVLSTNGFRCVKTMPSLDFWTEACGGGPAASQLAANMTPFLMAWLLIAVIGASAAPAIARWFAMLRRDSLRGGPLLACCLTLLLVPVGASWYYLDHVQRNAELWYREIAVNPHWKLLRSTTEVQVRD